jgi:hypothetical protein
MPGTTDDDSTGPTRPDTGRGPQDRTPGAQTVSLARNDLFNLLQSRRRRLTLWYLHERTDGSERLQPLSTHVAALEADVDPREVDPSARQRARTSLCQSHLPKLVDAGVVTYDDGRELVALTALADAFVPYLVAEPDRSVVV